MWIEKTPCLSDINTVGGRNPGKNQLRCRKTHVDNGINYLSAGDRRISSISNISLVDLLFDSLFGIETCS